MLRRLTGVLVAVIIAIAATMPGGARAMTMQGGPMQAGASQPCQQCPDDPMPAPMSSKMALCQMVVCAGPFLVQPTVISTDHPVAHRIAYPARRPARLAGATPVPDPFPPRPVVLL
jgi:hypothetical protein